MNQEFIAAWLAGEKALLLKRMMGSSRIFGKLWESVSFEIPMMSKEDENLREIEHDVNWAVGLCC